LIANLNIMPQAIPREIVSELLESLNHANQQESRRPEQAIHVSEITSLPAFAYEKLRNIVDYKEENLLRKNAIRRFLKRKFLLPQDNLESIIASELIRELILSRYVPNDSVSESLVSNLAQLLNKYYALFNEVRQRGCNIPRWREQLLGLTAVECDNLIVSPQKRLAYTTLATKLIRPTLDFSSLTTSADAQNVQLILIVERVLNRADRDILNYYLLLHYYPNWFNLDKLAAVQYLAPQIPQLLQAFAKISNDKLGKRLIPIVKKLLVPVVILRQMLSRYTGRIDELIRQPQKLEQQIRSTYQQYWLDTRRRIRRKGFHAMAYIFITKIVLAILLELPYEQFVLGHINYLPLGINLLFPPLLMLIITLLIKSPDKQNEEKSIAGTNELVYGQTSNFYTSKRLTDKSPRIWAKLFYALLYTLTITASFSAILLVLWRLGFNVLSAALFIFFISLVSFFGINLRQQARQLKVISGRETITSFIIDFFSFPIIAFGRWLSNTFDRYNFFVFILDFMFEIPFKTILRIIEDWFHFLKEKKEEIL